MTFRQTVKRFFEPVKYFPKSYTYFVFSEMFDVFQSVFVIQLWFYMISAVEWHNTQNLIYRWWVMWIFALLKYALELGAQVIYEYVWFKWWFFIKKDILKNFIILDNSAIEKLGTWKVQNILLTGVDARIQTLTWTVTGITLEVAWIFYAFILIIQKSPTVYHTIGLSMLFVISAWMIRKWLRILEWVRKESKLIDGEIARNDVKIIMSKVEILQNNKLPYEIWQQYKLISKQTDLWKTWNFKKWLWQIWWDMLIKALELWVYVGIGIGVILGQYKIAYMMILLQLISLIYRYLWQLRNYFKAFFDRKTHIEKLRDLLDNNKSLQKYTEWSEFKYKKWDIYIDNIGFRYHDANVFDNFSLELKWWTKTAFVGESGWGKTTLIKLLAWYLRPDSGEIIIDGQKLSEVKLTDYYHHIGYLTQEPSVFDGTVWENLTYALDVGADIIRPLDGDMDTDAWYASLQSQIETIIKLAKCEFIYEFEHGLQTEIGERWVRLSGGQKQRLAIAKIMLKNPNIILLDEPTSALDSFNEEMVSEALNNLFKWRTVIVVAHRLQTVKNADRILYIEWGQVIEDGTHASLIKKNGNYKKMLDLQSGF